MKWCSAKESNLAGHLRQPGYGRFGLHSRLALHYFFSRYRPSRPSNKVERDQGVQRFSTACKAVAWPFSQTRSRQPYC